MAKEKLIITATKEESSLSIYIKAPKKVEQYYENLKTGSQTSTCWKDENNNGVEFYKMEENFLEEEKEFLRRYNFETYSDFGSALTRRERYNLFAINIAMLRAKGIGDGITFNSTDFRIGVQDLETFIRQFAKVLKVLIAEKIGKKTIKAVVSYEI